MPHQNKLIPLCVPYEQREKAKSAGARWDVIHKVWQCSQSQLHGPAYSRIKVFVPRMYRPDLKPPYLRPWMVPQPLWGKNLRALLSQKQWDQVRKDAYARSGYRCKVCGSKGSQWPVEADEAWEYDDERLTHTLKGVIALCPDCHRVRHWGKSMVDGKTEEALAHLMKVNNIGRFEAKHIADEAMAQWQIRSQKTWVSDYSWIKQEYGFEIEPEGYARAKQANNQLVQLASRRSRRESAGINIEFLFQSDLEDGGVFDTIFGEGTSAKNIVQATPVVPTPSSIQKMQVAAKPKRSLWQKFQTLISRGS